MIKFTYLRDNEVHNFLLVNYPALHRVRLFREARESGRKIFNGELVMFNFESLEYKFYIFTSSGGNSEDIHNKIGRFLEA